MGSKNKDAKTAVAATPAQPVVPTQTLTAFMPGQQGLLADQLAAGGFGTAPQNMGILGGMYRDQTSPIISRPDQIAQYLTQIGMKPGASTEVAKTDKKPTSKIGTGRG